jgi:hypothetical protein
MTPVPDLSCLFISGPVSEGHPDKLCDRLSPSILDVPLAEDHHGRVAYDTMLDHRRVIAPGNPNPGKLRILMPCKNPPNPRGLRYSDKGSRRNENGAIHMRAKSRFASTATPRASASLRNLFRQFFPKTMKTGE